MWLRIVCYRIEVLEWTQRSSLWCLCPSKMFFHSLTNSTGAQCEEGVVNAVVLYSRCNLLFIFSLSDLLLLKDDFSKPWLSRDW